jgi:hypothetical protein
MAPSMSEFLGRARVVDLTCPLAVPQDPWILALIG